MHLLNARRPREILLPGGQRMRAEERGEEEETSIIAWTIPSRNPAFVGEGKIQLAKDKSV